MAKTKNDIVVLRPGQIVEIVMEMRSVTEAESRSIQEAEQHAASSVNGETKSRRLKSPKAKTSRRRNS